MATASTFPAATPAEKKQSSFERLLAWLATCRFLTVSVLIHSFIVLGFGGVVLFRAMPELPDFVAGSEDGLVSQDVSPAAPEISQPVPQEFTPPTPSMAQIPLSAIVTTSPQTPTFTVNTATVAGISDSMKGALSSMNSGRAAGASGGIGRMGGMSSLTFFGMKTKAKRIAFLVDYSGSMEGPFRKEMEEELERSLKGLPPGTEVLIIPWAGGAWLYNQLAVDIEKKWQKGTNYDDFSLRKGEKLTPPDWVPVNPDNILKLMKGVQAQKSWPGGTDWRSPFNYAMEAKPAPDSIFFLTDGQIENVQRAMTDIDKALKRAPTPPIVFSLYIVNKAYKGDYMKDLAQKYKGDYREIGKDKK